MLARAADDRAPYDVAIAQPDDGGESTYRQPHITDAEMTRLRPAAVVAFASSSPQTSCRRRAVRSSSSSSFCDGRR